MDHYKLLGVHKNASKEEIKQAFRKLAMEFHPDKHSQSSNNLRDSATQKFKQLSEAYETLIDDRKRADYNLRRNAYGAHQSKRGGGGGVFVRFEMGLRYLTTKSFLLNATFFSVLLGGMYIIDASGKALWKMRNTGKSFEEAIESIENAKAGKDNSD
ncbi:hypothetical protein C2S51_010634 [Perilla frutescens var. frutescens]|nr:hypothetical protein C2S51_010634 [Perilla frutescens var. frutescens]